MPGLNPSTPVSVGDVVDNRYELRTLVSHTGRETMFRGRQVSLNRDVAVKVLDRDADADDARRFFNEARSVAQLEHPNCMQVLEYGETPAGVRFIAINFAGGHPLSMDLGTPMPEGQATLYMKDILQGLEHAHSRGVSHRELTPDAIMVSGALDGHERAVITEFGGAATTDVGPALTLGEMLAGNPRYASPEQAAGLSADESSDLYSAGIIFFELLTGRPPFENEDPVSLMQMHLENPLPDFGPMVSEGLANIVRKLAAKQRHERYASATEALADLDQHLNGMSSTSNIMAASAETAVSDAPRVTSPGLVVNEQPVAPPSRRGLWIGLAAAALGMIAVGAVVAAPGSTESVAAASVAGTTTPSPEPASDSGSLALLAQVNDSTTPLEYGARQQALAILADNEYGKNVDARLQTKLDLLQASTAPEPCPTFSKALDKALSDQSTYFHSVLDTVAAPDNCSDAEQKLADARAEDAEPEPEAPPVVAAVEPKPHRPAHRQRNRAERKPRKSEPPAPAATPAPTPAPPKKKASDGGITKIGSGLKSINPAP